LVQEQAVKDLAFFRQVLDGIQRGLDLRHFVNCPDLGARFGLLRSLRPVRQSGTMPAWTAGDIGALLQFTGNKDWVRAAQVEENNRCRGDPNGGP